MMESKISRKLSAFSTQIYAVILWSFLAIIASYGAEHLLLLAPCRLCLYQRYIYCMVAIVGVMAALFWRKIALKTPFFVLFCLLLSLEMGTAIFHLGVEHSWWEYSSSCVNNLHLAKSLAEFKQMVAAADLVPCDMPAKLLGVSMTLWNILYSLGGVTIALIMLRTRNQSSL